MCRRQNRANPPFNSYLFSFALKWCELNAFRNLRSLCHSRKQSLLVFTRRSDWPDQYGPELCRYRVHVEVDCRCCKIYFEVDFAVMQYRECCGTDIHGQSRCYIIKQNTVSWYHRQWIYKINIICAMAICLFSFQTESFSHFLTDLSFANYIWWEIVAFMFLICLYVANYSWLVKYKIIFGIHC